MDSKRGISFQWRLFMPTIITFWFIIISMAAWQMHRVRQIKQRLVKDQLSLIGERVAVLYDHNNPERCEDLMLFINKYYEEARNYDPINIQVREPDGSLGLSIGDLSADIPLDINPDIEYAMVKIDDPAGDDSHKKSYLYYRTTTDDNDEVLVLLPFTREVSSILSANTTKFWLIFFSIGIFASILAYISSTYLSRNVKVLRNFSVMAAKKPDLVGIDTENLPHDELGEISRQIINLYNQRIALMEQRERDHKIALHAIDEKNRMKRELTANINHELKTPVGVIQGYIDTIIDNPDMDIETRDKFLYKAQLSVHRLTALIADVTAITKLESDGKLINVSELNFHDLVYSMANYIDEAKLLKDKLEFNFDIPIECMVVGNESLITTSLLNLVKNAVAYSGGTECRIECTSEDDDFYYFSFYDDGIGVPPEHLPHMFERFYRVNASRSRDTGGTGLGLTIVKVTFETLGGNIEVNNRFPSGLEFKFFLPKHKSASYSQHNH